MTVAELPALLEDLGLSRDDVVELFAELTERITAEVEAVEAEHRAGAVWPTAEFADVAAGRVDDATAEAVRRRGCVVVRGNFERAQAVDWDRGVGDYLAVNGFEERFAERNPDAAASGSPIWGVYWSPAQVAARQHPNMEATRRFLNSFWHHESDGRDWFDPSRDIGYPDRLRRRAPGTASKGLPAHSDAVSGGGWRIEENVRVFHHVLAREPDRYDPWDAAHRTDVEHDSTAPSSVFRTFQGWTALSDMHPGDGVLHTVPIPPAAAYMLVRGIAGEIGPLGDEPEAAPRRFRADDLLMRAMVPIPPVEPGDTVWWHGDVIHSVADASNDTRWGNVMYIAATPSCPRNDVYRSTMLDRFRGGLSPVDFPEEHFEADFRGRPSVDDLNAIGRGHFGLPVSSS